MIKESQMGGVTLDEIIQVLNHCMDENDPKIICVQIENLRSRCQTPEYSDRLGQILGAFKVPDAHMGVVTKDPISGKPYPNSKGLIQKLLQDLEGHKKMSNQSFNFNKYAQEKKKDKKKSRGNPFRVLMGKVGKLLDHGLEKREIVRYLLKEKIWNEDTISNAVKIVKEYNKKKHRKTHTKEAQTLPNTAEDWPRLDLDYSKRSNAELIASICWLNSLQKMNSKNNSFGKEVADRSGVKTMISKIKSVLKDRGMSEEALNEIMK
jgi:hypothetical protein